MANYKFIIMCGGIYRQWQKPRQLLEINGEPIVARTIRLLRENGIEDIAISSNLPDFDKFGVPVLAHENSYDTKGYNDHTGQWADAFYPCEEPVCYLFGDVVFSPEAINKIIEKETDSIEFFASAPPFDPRYVKEWAEPFALKVVDNAKLKCAVEDTRLLDFDGFFARKPIMWELWQVIKRTPLNIIDYTNYTVINDWTCDVDSPDDIEMIARYVNG